MKATLRGIPMRRYMATLFTAMALLGVVAGPASADTLIGVNVCDTSVLVENDDAASNQCVNK